MQKIHACMICLSEGEVGSGRNPRVVTSMFIIMIISGPSKSLSVPLELRTPKVSGVQPREFGGPNSHLRKHTISEKWRSPIEHHREMHSVRVRPSEGISGNWEKGIDLFTQMLCYFPSDELIRCILSEIQQTKFCWLQKTTELETLRKKGYLDQQNILKSDRVSAIAPWFWDMK